MKESDNLNSSEKLPATRRFVLILIIVVLATSLAAVTIEYVSVLQKLNDLQNQVSTLKTSQYQVIPENISLSQLYDNVRDSVVMIHGFTSQPPAEVGGSGFIYNYTGRMVVVTNYHVIDGLTDISVTFRDGHAYAAAVLGYDGYSDLAVLSVTAAPASEFKPLQVVSSSTLSVGDYVIAIGSPFGLTGSLTTGIVSQLGRTITEPTSSYPIADVIQTSTPINPGNSGGPLLNDQGQVVGITTAVVNGSQGVGFAIPSNIIIREITSLVTFPYSYTQHPLLGIAGTDMTYDIAHTMNLNVTYGVLITQVTSGGPADKAGLKPEDVIIAINGNHIGNVDDLSTYLEENTRPNQRITITIMRTTGTIIRTIHKMNIDVTLGTRPPLS